MTAQLSKWGNSIAVRIPAALLKELDVSVGHPVEITVRDGSLILTPVPAPTYTLDELLEGMTSDNMYDEVVTSGPVGNEVW